MTEIADSLYFVILDHITKSGIGIDTDVSHIVDRYFTQPNGVDHLIWSSRYNDIFDYLNIIQSNGHIKYSHEYIKDEPKEVYEWVKPIIIKAQITQSGLDYYYADVLRKSTIKSFNNQFKYNLITWAIAILAIGVSIYTIIQNTDLSQRLSQQQQELQQLKYPQHLPVAIHRNSYTTQKKP